MSGWSLEYNIDVDLDNRVIYSKIYGVWRATTARSYHEDYKEEAVPLLDKPWAKYVDLSNWKTGSQEVIDVIAEHIKWSEKQKMVIGVYIINNPVTYPQLMKMITGSGDSGSSLTFRTKQEGLKAIEEAGFKVVTEGRNI